MKREDVTIGIGDGEPLQPMPRDEGLLNHARAKRADMIEQGIRVRCIEIQRNVK